MTDSIREKREIERSESFHTAAKIISGLLPGGGTVYELFAAIVQPLHEKRREDWVRDVIFRLHKLEKKGKIDLKELQVNEEFNTVITKATLIAQQSHQEEKLNALKNIVQNSSETAYNKTLDFELIDYFLSIVNRISPLHIYILEILKSPSLIVEGIEAEKKKKEKTPVYPISPTPYSIILNHNSILEEDRVSLCWNDLIIFNLVESISFNDIIPDFTKSGRIIISKFGKRFLKSIKDEE